MLRALQSRDARYVPDYSNLCQATKHRVKEGRTLVKAGAKYGTSGKTWRRGRAAHAEP